MGNLKKLTNFLLGKPRNINDPSFLKKITFIPIIAWIGLGADGLSSAAYGPEEAYRALHQHTHLAPFIGLATVITIFIISKCYANIIQHFPSSGGGYRVVSSTLGHHAGVLSGSALIVDYVLTIPVSIAACGDALFSFAPRDMIYLKLPFELGIIIVITVLNIRGVKETIGFLTPVFIIFITAHLVMIGGGFIMHWRDIPAVTGGVHSQFVLDLSVIKPIGIMLILFHAYSLGGGTYTGLEAISNSLHYLREPRVKNGKRTMMYMCWSLALLVMALFMLYLLFDVRPHELKTMNASLAQRVFQGWPGGYEIAFIVILSEALLLVSATQTGFISAPQVMADMAMDYRFPRGFANISERLTIQNGVLFMGALSGIILVATGGNMRTLIVMYAINVFITFTLSQIGMARFFIQHQGQIPAWRRQFSLHVLGALLCGSILVITAMEKYAAGGWKTIVITVILIAGSFAVHAHYARIRRALSALDEVLLSFPASYAEKKRSHKKINPKLPTAVILVNGYNGLGVHCILTIIRKFPRLYRQFIFVSIAVLDADLLHDFKRVEEVRAQTAAALVKYVHLARQLGFPADSRMAEGTDVVEMATSLCKATVQEFADSSVYSGKLIFEEDRFYYRLLHNHASYAIQRRLHWIGITSIVLPVKITI